MKTVAIGKSDLKGSRIALGCMRIAGMNRKQGETLLRTALDAGINFFDHADIYAQGQAEAKFAEALDMRPAIRDTMVLQTKCAIRPGVCYDFSKEHILHSVDESLKRLRTEYVDILLLHRPDILMEPEEVAAAFDTLERAGKVRQFGVSNHNPGQIALLNHYCGGRIAVNQIQLSVMHCPAFDASIHVNMGDSLAASRENGVVEYCRLNGITLQAWSPFQYGMFEGVFLDNPLFPELNAKLNEVAERHGVTNSAIAIAWILRHPAGIQAIVGTTKTGRLLDIAKADEVALSREEWYEIYLAAGKTLP